MNLVTQAELARRMKVSRQAISKAAKAGLLKIIVQGKKKLIDLDDYNTILYQKSHNLQRNPLIKQTVPGTKLLKKNRKEATGESPGLTDDEKESIQLQMELLRARVERTEQEAIKKKLENAFKRGELISKEKVYTYLMFYLDRTAKKLELLAGTFLSDIGSMIITEEKVTPEISKRWVDEILKQIDEAKNQTIEYIKKIEKEQAG